MQDYPKSVLAKHFVLIDKKVLLQVNNKSLGIIKTKISVCYNARQNITLEFAQSFAKLYALQFVAKYFFMGAIIENKVTYSLI